MKEIFPAYWKEFIATYNLEWQEIEIPWPPELENDDDIQPF